MKAKAVVLAMVISAISSGLIYPETAQVVKLDRKKDIVRVETSTGNPFEFRGCEDWEKGDLCSMIMWSNGTKKVKDDKVISVKYSSKFR